jgi:Fe-S-cluster containining protein
MTQGFRHPVFQCQQCGDCCQGRGGIFLTSAEAKQIAAHLKLSLEEFLRRYVEVSALGPSVTTANGVCVFLGEGNRCLVHPVKPFICRQWPFLPALLADPEEFEQAKGACPGIDPDCSHEDFVEASRKLSGKILKR